MAYGLSRASYGMRFVILRDIPPFLNVSKQLAPTTFLETNGSISLKGCIGGRWDRFACLPSKLLPLPFRTNIPEWFYLSPPLIYPQFTMAESQTKQCVILINCPSNNMSYVYYISHLFIPIYFISNSVNCGNCDVTCFRYFPPPSCNFFSVLLFLSLQNYWCFSCWP